MKAVYSACLLFAAFCLSSGFVTPIISHGAQLSLSRAFQSAPLGVRITPDGSPSMQEYRKKIIEDMISVKKDSEFDGYQLFDLIVAKWGVPYGVEMRRLDFGGKKLLYANVMWKYLGQQSFPLTERAYLEHLEYIARKLVEWGQVGAFKQFLADCRKKPVEYFGYAVSIPINISEEEVERFVEEARLPDEE